MTALDYLASVKTRSAAASPGPWGWDDGAIMCGAAENKAGSMFGFSSIPAQYHAGDDYQTPAGVDSDRDADFIAHARTDIPRLVAMVEAAYKALADIVADDEPQLECRFEWEIAGDALAELDRIAAGEAGE